MSVRVTRKVRRIALAIHTLDQPSGLAICRETGLGSGTVYPILDRLLTAGWIGSRRVPNPQVGRPARTIYHLTLRGQIGVGVEPGVKP
ncbi:PadR family transcriptional regulator [Streptomyces sp. NPDC060188]|uniref:PadR family transcriptional regulator n=1 Tax=Streptomyces sp. NPDC060188 TaxID=3347068 RepID=UPI003657B684